MEPWLVPFLVQMAYGLPVILVDIVGMILALIWRRRHPRASLFFLLGVVIFLVTNIVSTFLAFWLPHHLEVSRGWSPMQAYMVMPYLYLGRSLIAALAWSLVLVAVFCDRTEARTEAGTP